jgi:hypothetical protein
LVLAVALAELLKPVEAAPEDTEPLPEPDPDPDPDSSEEDPEASRVIVDEPYVTVVTELAYANV